QHRPGLAAATPGEGAGAGRGSCRSAGGTRRRGDQLAWGPRAGCSGCAGSHLGTPAGGGEAMGPGQPGQRRGLAGHQHDPALGSAGRSAFHGSNAVQPHPGGPVMPADPTETSALFRFAVIAEALNSRLGAKERGRLVREIAARVHTMPDGNQVMVS
ncbi:hypothetical protein B2A_09889, partial [mine drainage metagenome]